MSIAELILLGVALSMDAFAVSVCKGLATGNVRLKHMCIAGAWFGGFSGAHAVSRFCAWLGVL